MIDRGSTYRLEQFSASGNRLVADASDLGLRPGDVPAHRISVLLSPEHIETFVHVRTDMDGYEDVQGWRFYKTNPFNRFAEVLIAND